MFNTLMLVFLINWKCKCILSLHIGTASVDDMRTVIASSLTPDILKSLKRKRKYKH